MNRYRKISQKEVAAINSKVKKGKHITSKQLGDVIYTDELKEGRSPKKAEKIAGGVIGKIARQRHNKR